VIFPKKEKMSTHSDKVQEDKSHAISNNKGNNSKVATYFPFHDNRPEVIAQRQVHRMVENSQKAKEMQNFKGMMTNGHSAILQKHGLEEEIQRKSEPIQKKSNDTGLPDNLKNGIENLSGYSLNDVKVHFNSSQPAQLNALAYAQGTDIHLGPGQEKHLPHEAWHVVQQKQGRVKPTLQMKGTVQINDDEGLEREADIMGAKALKTSGSETLQKKEAKSGMVIQRKPDLDVRKTKLHDERMEALKVRTDFIMAGLNDTGINKEEELGKFGEEKAREKVKSVWTKSEEQSKIKKLFNEIWKRLTWEERWEIFVMAARTVGSALWNVFKGALGEIGSSGREKESRRMDEQTESGVSFTDFITLGYKGVDGLSKEQIEALYEAMKKYRKIKTKVEEVQNEVLKGAGDLGRKVGSFIGANMDDRSLLSLVTAQRSDWQGAKEQYYLLRSEIVKNEDFGRYGFLVGILDAIFKDINQFTLVMNGIVSPAGVREALEVAKGYKAKLLKVNILKEERSGIGMFTHWIPWSEVDETLLKDREQLASTIKRALKTDDWSVVTQGWRSKPTTVGKMADVSNRLGGEDYLNQMKTLAEKAGKGTKRRDTVTTRFYSTLKGIKVNDNQNLKSATQTVIQVEKQLKTKKTAKDSQVKETVTDVVNIVK
jgi:hypothetical protein